MKTRAATWCLAGFIVVVFCAAGWLSVQILTDSWAPPCNLVGVTTTTDWSLVATEDQAPCP